MVFIRFCLAYNSWFVQGIIKSIIPWFVQGIIESIIPWFVQGIVDPTEAKKFAKQPK